MTQKSVALRVWGYMTSDGSARSADCEKIMGWLRFRGFKWEFGTYLYLFVTLILKSWLK